MRVTIYADMLWLINFAADYAILTALALLIGIKMDKKCILRMLAASLCGAFYAVLTVMPGFAFLAAFWGRAASCLMVVYIAFPAENVRAFFKKCLLFFLLALLFGGLIFAVQLAAVGQYQRLPVIFLLLLMPACLAGVYFLSRVLSKRRAMPEHTDLIITYHGRCVAVPLLLDTGNRLCDPITGAPVIIVAYTALLPLFAGEEARLAQLAHGDTSQLPPGFRLLVYRTAGGESALLPVFHPDKIQLPGYEKETGGQVLIGVSGDDFDRDGGYQGLMHPDQIVKHMKVIS